MLPEKSTGGVKICFKKGGLNWFSGEGAIDSYDGEADAFAEATML